MSSDSQTYTMLRYFLRDAQYGTCYIVSPFISEREETPNCSIPHSSFGAFSGEFISSIIFFDTRVPRAALLTFDLSANLEHSLPTFQEQLYVAFTPKLGFDNIFPTLTWHIFGTAFYNKAVICRIFNVRDVLMECSHESLTLSH